ncbi:MAG: tyrosine-type recombinase/integrase [Pseudonocardiaceae bacterium]
MTGGEGVRQRDLITLVVDDVGSVVVTGVIWEPYRLLDPGGDVVGCVSRFLHDLQASGRSVATQRSYALDLLRWFRFLWAIDVPWAQATREEARDFSRWLALVDKPRRAGTVKQMAGAANPVTGKRSPGGKYAASTLAHSETVLRGFYAFHLEAGTGPIINPFPLVRERAGGRAHAHHNPMEPFGKERSGRYRPRLAQRVPRRIPDERFNQIFAQLRSDRDRALVAFWVSTGARAAELLGARGGDVDAGQQLITVVRKGSRAVQQLPACADAFGWLRLYQCSLARSVPAGADDPLWWTSRGAPRPLTYHAARAMFTRANQVLGANWSLHDLRHTAAYRMVRDPQLPLCDVQWVLGHANLSSTQLYVTPAPNEVITEVLAHHQRRRSAETSADGHTTTAEDTGCTGSGYRAESLATLFSKPAS